LIQIFGGLIYYALEDYEDALIAFETASEVPDWNNTEGKEVLHVLIGNTYVKLASVEAQNGNIALAQQWLNSADETYQLAVNLAPDYSRPYTGLASSEYLRWNVDFQEIGTSDRTYLERSLDYLDAAENALDGSKDIGIQTKELFIRLQVTFVSWQFHKQEFSDSELEVIYDEIQHIAEQIIRRYDDGNNPSVQEITSETNSILGLTAMTQGNCDEAIDFFEAAINLSFSRQRQMFFYGWQGDCYLSINQPALAAQIYEKALDIAQELDASQDTIDRYQSELTELRGRG